MKLSAKVLAASVTFFLAQSAFATGTKTCILKDEKGNIITTHQVNSIPTLAKWICANRAKAEGAASYSLK